MKKTVIVLLALFVPASLWAMDIDQGKFELSGTTAFSFSDRTTEVDGAPDLDTTTWSFELDGNYYSSTGIRRRWGGCGSVLRQGTHATLDFRRG